MIKPNFFMVGAPRCATTTMYTYLKQHPDIFLSLLKEPIFFGSDLTRQPLAVDDEASYLSLFAGAGAAPVVGEGSVFYLMSTRAAEELHAFSPAARILIMLRDPIDMMHSLHALYLRTHNDELADFDAAVEAEADRAAGRRLPARCYFPEGLQYTRHARYAEPVARFLRVFGRDRVHVVVFDDLVRDAAAVVRGVLAFLGVVDHPVELDVDKATEHIRPIILRQMRAASPEIRRKLKIGRDSHRGPRSRPVSPALRARLAAELAPDVARLGELLDRDLGHWCRSVAA
ncbi:MAG TPA: sulfotransferase [Kofleriaceae bacterium]|nr:sulfotransferase [Kofleriaceae bacterium]